MDRAGVAEARDRLVVLAQDSTHVDDTLASRLSRLGEAPRRPRPLPRLCGLG